MVAVFTGNGLGLFNTSLTQLDGGSGGTSGLGQLRSGQYVNAATGNLVLQELDESLLVRGLNATFLRTYNSRGTVTGVGQDGFVTGFERRVALTGTLNQAGSTMTLYTGDGQSMVFTYSGTTNKYVTTAGDGAHDTLVWNATAKTWTYTEGSTRREELYADHASATLKGRLTRIRDLKSDGTTPAQFDVMYDASGRIIEVRSVDGSGATADAILFGYSGSSTQLTSVTTREGGQVRSQMFYEYDTYGRLVSVLTDLTPGQSGDNTWNGTTASSNDGKLFKTTYAYVASATPENELRIASVTTSDGYTVAYTYESDAAGGYRVKTVTQGSTTDGSSQMVSFVYSANSTDVIEGPAGGGGRTWTYQYDANKQLTAVLEPAVNGLRQKTSYSYDTAGNVTRISVAGDATNTGTTTQLDTVFFYDANGNRTLQRDRLGNTIAWTYDASNQVTTETRYTVADADGLDPGNTGATNAPTGALTTHYVYDARSRLRFVVDAAGEVRELTYATSGNGIGQVATERRYIGSPYTGTTWTESALNAWATNATAKPKSNSALTAYSYDAKGRLSQTVQYASVSADVNGSGVFDAASSLTTFAYDAQGLLRQQVTVHGASRTVGGTAPTGSEVVDYVYDGMGRLTSVLKRAVPTAAMPDYSDPANAQAFADWLEANDGTTVLTQYAYVDSANQLRVTLDSGMIRTEARNKAGQFVSISESGTVSGATVTRTTQHYYDSTGRLRASEDAAGARTYYFYDRDGRLTATVDGTGAVVRTEYDSVGRVAQTVAYATSVDTSAWLSGGAVVKDTLVFAATAPGLATGEAWVPTDATRDQTTQKTYDAAGRLSTETVAGADAGQTLKTTYTYDGANRLTQVVVSDGAGTAATARTTRYLYDAADRPVAVVDAKGYVTETVYDYAGRAVKTVRYANAATNPAAADLATLKASITASATSDQATRYFYDGRGNQVGMLDAEGSLTEYIYDEAANQRAVKAYAKRLTGLSGTEALSALRTLATTGAPTEAYRLTQRTFNDLGQLLTEVNAEGTVTRYTYDEAGRLVKTELAQGTSEVREGNLRYDVFGNLIGELGGEGSTHLLANMSEAQLDAVYAQYGVRHSYDLLGRRIESIDAQGNKTWYFHDADGRQTFVVRGQRDSGNVQNAVGEVTETRYDAFGQVLDSIAYTGLIAIPVPGDRSSLQGALSTFAVVSTLDSRVQRSYDRRGLMTQSIDADGYRSSYAYDAFGELTTRQDFEADGTTVRRTASWSYDARGQVVATGESGGGLSRGTSTVYDAFGRAISQTDARGTVATQAYDRLGRVVSSSRTVGARTETVATTYDAFGRTLTTTDARGYATTYSYSDTNRSMTVTSAEGVSVTTTHDRFGQTVTVSQALPGGGTATTTTAYDKDGHVTSVTDPLGKVSTDEYDARGLLTATVDATGRRIEYTYDAAGRILTRREDPAGLNLVTTTVYDGQGRKLTVTDASGRSMTMAYDRRGNLTETVQDPTGLALRTKYTWDRDGRQLTVTEGAESPVATTTAYVYDALGRRTQEIRGSGSLDLTTTYAYDANDNVVSTTDGSGRVVHYAYDAANRLRFTVDALGDVTEVRYDADGRMAMTRRYAKALNPASLSTWSESEIAAQATTQAIANDALDETDYVVHDRDGRVAMTIDGAGDVTTVSYDSAGRKLAERRYITTIALDTNQLDALNDGTATAADFAAFLTDATHLALAETTRYVYDVAGQVRYTVDATGAVNGWWYDAAGRVVATRRLAQRISLSLVNDGITKAQIDAAVGSGAETDAVEYFLYDGAGRVRYTLRTNSAAADYPNRASVTETRYDGAGRLLLSQTYLASMTLDLATAGKIAGGNGALSDLAAFVSANAGNVVSERRVYDTAGRLKHVVDAMGNVSSTWYDAASRVVVTRRMVNPIGTASLGDATTSAQVDGLLTWGANDDLRMYVYDGAGRQAYALQAVGSPLVFPFTASVTETRYDGAGRALLNRTYASLMTLDAALVDKLGSGTASVADFASFATANAGSAQATRHVYDTAGREVYTIDATGAYLRRWYDGIGRQTAQVKFAIPMSLVGVDDSSTVAQLDARLAWPNENETAYQVYDAAGRVRYTVQLISPSAAMVTDVGYDAAGRLLAQRRYTATMPFDQALAWKLVQGVAVEADFASFVASNAGSAQATRYVYDAAGELRYSIDALGYVTQTDRDALGRVVSQQTWRNPIAVTPALQAKLDAGTATAADVTAALAVSTTAAWSTGFDSVKPAGLDVSGLDPLNNGGAVIQNGRVEFRRVAGSSLNYPQIWSQDTYSLSQPLTYRVEVTTDNILTNNVLVLALNGNAAGGLQREGILIWNGQIYRHERASGVNGDALLGTLDVNTTYVVEIEVGATATTTYVYAKGKGRDSGYQFSRALTQANFGDYRLLMHGTTEPGVTGGSVFVDNLAILNGEAVQSVAYRYDAAGRVIAKLDGLGNTETYTYDAAGRLLSTTDANGNVSRNVYDAAGRLVYAIDPTGAFTRTWYDGNDRAVVVRRFNARFGASILSDAVRVGQLDAQLGTIGAWSAEFQTEYRIHDASGQLRFVLDGGGYLTRMEYDGAGRPTSSRRYASVFSTSDPTFNGRLFSGNANDADFATFVAANEASARAEATVYDAAGRVRYALQRNGSQWTVSERQYDGADRVTAETQFGVTIAYAPGQTEAQVATALAGAQARTTRYLYDAAGQQRFVLDAAGALTEQRYDGAGQVIETRAYAQLPTGTSVDTASMAAWTATQAAADIRKVTMTYDVAGRMTARTDALGHSESFTYDGAGRMLTRTDRNGAVWTYQYDAAGRRVAEISPQVAVSAVDASGTLSTTTRAIVTRYVYDALGQTTKKIEDADTASARVTQYAYDSRGLLVKTTLPNAGRIEPTTGALVFDTQPATVETTYDALGRAVVVKDENGKYSYRAYDSLGQVKAEVDQNGNVTAYYYDAYGDQTSMVRVAAALNTGAAAFTSVNWQPGQAMSWAQVSAGIDVNATGNRWIATAYDGLGRKTQVLMSSVTYWKADGTSTSGQPQTTYAYNAYGEVVKQSVLLEGTAGQADAVWADTWHYYDAMGRETTTVDAEGYVTTTEYNATGDATRVVEYARAVSTSGLGAQTPPALPAAGDATIGYDRETRWTYDLLGRKASETAVRHYRSVDGGSLVTDLVTAYGYDNEDRLTTVTDATGTVTTSYDARGQVVAVQEQARSVLADNASTLLQSTANTLSSASLYVQRSPYTTMAYDAFGNVVGVRRYANGKDGANAAVADDARDQIATTRYLGTGLAAMTRDALGNLSYSAYDAAGRLVHTWSRLEGSEDVRDVIVHGWYSYDDTGRQIGSSRTRNLVSDGTLAGTDQAEAVEYNAFGEIVRKTYGWGNTALSGELLYAYDAAGRMISDNATGATRSYGYNLAGHQVRESHKTWIDASTGAVDTVTLSQNDRLGRATSIRLPAYTANAADTPYVRQTFDRWGNVLQVIDARGYETDYRYDDRNQVVHETRPLVWVVNEDGSAGWVRPTNDWYYDALGRLSGTRDANGNLHAYAYDAAGRMVADTDALGNVTRHAYDALGNDVLTQDALGYITSKTYDQAGRVVATGDYLASGATRQANVLQTYVLDQNGDRLRVTDALGHTIRYDYDSQQRLIRSQTAMGVTMDYAYDVQGHKILERNAYFDGSTSFTDRDNRTVQLDGLSWTYDAYGRVTDHNLLSGRDVDYVYDPVSGQLMSESSSGGFGLTNNADGLKSYTYYANGRVRSIVESGAGEHVYAYDAAGNRIYEETTASDAYGEPVHTVTRTVYDSNNRVQRVTQDDVDDTGAVLKRVFDLQYDYDANGNRRRVTSTSGYGPNVDGIVVANTAPTVVSMPADRGVKKGQINQFRMLFSDVFRDAENDALTLAIARGDGSDLPSWLTCSRDPQTGEIVFTSLTEAGVADEDVVVRLTASETGNPASSATAVFTVRLRDNHAPILVSPDTATYTAFVGEGFGRDIAASDFFRDIDVNDALTLSVIGTGWPSWLSASTDAPGTLHLAGTPTSQGSYSFIVRATDPSGNSVDKQVTIVSAVNNAPTVESTPAPVVAKVGQSFSWIRPLPQIFQDLDGDSLLVTATGLPEWLSFQATTAQSQPELRLQGIVSPYEIDGRIYTVQFTATDSHGASATTTLQITTDGNLAPVAQMAEFDLPSIRVNDTLNYTISLSSLFVDPDGDALTVSPYIPPGSPLWSWLHYEVDRVAGTLRIFGTPSSPQSAGDFQFSLRASDPSGEYSTITVNIDVGSDTAPVRNATVALEDTTLSIGRSFSYVLPQNLFTDADGDAITLSAEVGRVVQVWVIDLENGVPGHWENSVEFEPLPSWMQFNPTTRTFSGTVPSGESARQFVLRITATDTRNLHNLENDQILGAAGVTTDADITVTLQPWANSAPQYVAGKLGGQTLVHGGSVDLPLPAGSFTEPDGDAMTYSAQVQIGGNWVDIGQIGLSVDPATGRITGTATNLVGTTINARILATDPQGLSGIGTFAFTVTNTPPVATTIPTQQVGRNVNWNFALSSFFSDVNSDALTYSVSGLPAALSLNAATGAITGQPTVALGSYTVTVTASDGRGGTASTSFTLQVTNSSPVPATIPNQTATAGSAWSYQAPAFTDPNGDTLTYTASGLPAWMSFNASTRTFSGNAATVGSWTITLTATDSSGVSASSSFVVTTPNVAPTATAIPQQSLGRNAAVTFGTAGYFSDINGDVLSYSASGLPAGLSINAATGVISGTPTTLGSATVTVSVADGRGGMASATFTMTVTNSAPVYATALPNRAGQMGAAVSWALPANTFTDANGDTLTYALWVEIPSHQQTYWRNPPGEWDVRTVAAQWVTASNAGLGIAANGTVSGNLGALSADGETFYSYRAKIVASDPSGASAEGIFTIGANAAPTAPSVSAPLAKQNLAYSLTLPAFGDANGDALTYTVGNLPPGLSFNAATRTISGTPTTGGAWTVSYSANDGMGGTASMSFTLTVETNVAPVAPSVGAQSGTTGASFIATLPAFTDSNGDTLTYSVGNLPPGLSFNATTRQVSGTPTTTGSWIVTYSANDGRGGTASTTFAFAVSAPVSNQPPVVSNPLADQWATGNTAFSYTIPANAFTDPEGSALSYGFSIVSSDILTGWLSFNAATRTFSGTPGKFLDGTITVRVTATDNQGQSVYDDFTLTVFPSGGGGNQFAATTTTTGRRGAGAMRFEMGIDPTRSAAPATAQTLVADTTTTTSATSTSVPVQVEERWFAYDANNRLTIANGELVGAAGAAGTHIELRADVWADVPQGTQKAVSDSYGMIYDAVGRETGRYQRVTVDGVTQEQVAFVGYDQRGNRLYETYAQALGGASHGIYRLNQYDAAGQLTEVRRFFELGEMRQVWVAPIDRYGQDAPPPEGSEPWVAETMDVGGWLMQAETYRYDGDGRLRVQTNYGRETNFKYYLGVGGGGNQYGDLSLLTFNSRTEYTLADATPDNPDDNATAYDGAGRLVSYRYSASGAGAASGYTNTYTSTYEGWESWQETKVEGQSDAQYYREAINTLSLDAYGRITQQREHVLYDGTHDQIRAYTYTGDGQVLTRRHGYWDSGFHQTTKTDIYGDPIPQNYRMVYAAGQQVAELEAGGSKRVTLPTGGMAAVQAASARLLAWQPTEKNQLSEMNGVAGSGVYQAGGQLVTVSEGETLQSLAQRVYGSATLWYVLADANGMSEPTAPLTAGVRLKAPSVGVTRNDASTFQPYDPGKAIGSTTPNVPYIPPPSGAGCSTAAMILMVVIAVVVTIYTAGAATSAMLSAYGATTAGMSTMAVGMAALSGGMIGTASLTAVGAMAVAAVAGAAGAAVSMAAGSLMGVAKFSWRQVASAGITAGITAGIGNSGWLQEIAKNAKYGQVARAAVSAGLGNVGGYAANRAAGVEDTHFNWKDVLASATTAAATSYVSPYLSKKLHIDPSTTAGQAQSKLLSGVMGGMTGVYLRHRLGLSKGIDYSGVASDVIGTLIGDSFTGENEMQAAKYAQMEQVDMGGDLSLVEMPQDDDIGETQAALYAKLQNDFDERLSSWKMPGQQSADAPGHAISVSGGASNEMETIKVTAPRLRWNQGKHAYTIPGTLEEYLAMPKIDRVLSRQHLHEFYEYFHNDYPDELPPFADRSDKGVFEYIQNYEIPFQKMRGDGALVANHPIKYALADGLGGLAGLGQTDVDLAEGLKNLAKMGADASSVSWKIRHGSGLSSSDYESIARFGDTVSSVEDFIQSDRKTQIIVESYVDRFWNADRVAGRGGYRDRFLAGKIRGSASSEIAVNVLTAGEATVAVGGRVAAVGGRLSGWAAEASGYGGLSRLPKDGDFFGGLEPPQFDVAANSGAPRFSLKFTEVNGVKTWESPAGLRYGPDPSPNFGNRVQHVMNHAADIPNRPGKHGVFDSRQDALPLIDEAWVKIQNGDSGVLRTTNPAAGAVPARDVYQVPMGRRVGYVGGVWGNANGLPAASYLRIVVENGNNVVSAFPVLP